MHRTILCLLTLLAALRGASAAATRVIEKQIGLPRGTVEGFLDNGLHYLVVPNELPRHTVELRLVMRVGSLQETDSQKGGAHFLEHLAFTGTRHFPGSSWVDFFERQGMKYGRDINAFTGFDRTVYWLTLPTETDGTDILDSTLLAVSDILEGISFDPVAIASERGVIKEELRSYTTGDDFYDLKIGRGRYPERMPLGTETDIDGIASDDLRRFHADWYGPQNATLIVVGNVDAQATARCIAQRFSSIARRGRTAGAAQPLSYASGVTLQQVGDSLIGSSRLELILPQPTVEASTIEKTALKERRRLLVRLLNNRMAARRLRCDVSLQWYLAETDHFVLSTEGGTATMERALAELWLAARQGFGADELADAISQSSQRLRVDTTATATSEGLCDDFIDLVVAGDRHITRPEDMLLVRQLVEQTNSAGLQRLLADILANGQTFLLAAHTNAGGPQESLSEKQIKQLWKHSKRLRVEPFSYTPPQREPESRTEVPTVLTEKHPLACGAVVSEHRYDDLQLTEYVLQNGLRIWSRPTLEADSTLHMAFIARGGLADLSARDYRLLKDAAGYVEMGGLKRIAPDTLMNVMIEQGLSMSMGIDNRWHQLLASAPVPSAQMLFNLTFEKMTAPGQDREFFEEARSEELEGEARESVLERMLLHDTDRMLSARVDSLVGATPSGDYLEPLTRKEIEQLSLDSLTAYYRSLFSDPRQAVLILTGNFHGHDVVQEAISTFALLSPDSLSRSYADKATQMPQEPRTDRFEGDNDTQLTLNYIFPGNYEPSLRNSLMLKLMRDVLQERLLSELRERLNIVYSPYTDLYYEGRPQQKFHFWLTVAVKKENRLRAEEAIRAMVEELQRESIGADELERLKRSFIVTKRKSLADDAPSEWKTALTALVKNGEQLSDYDRYTQVLSSITPQDLLAAFRQYVRFDRLQLLTKE